MSGSPRRPGISHERRIPPRRTLSTRDAAPGGCPRRLHCRGRIGLQRGRDRGHPAKHSETSPRRPAWAVGSLYRAADLRWTGWGLARRSRAWSLRRPVAARRNSEPVPGVYTVMKLMSSGWWRPVVMAAAIALSLPVASTRSALAAPTYAQLVGQKLMVAM